MKVVLNFKKYFKNTEMFHFYPAWCASGLSPRDAEAGEALQVPGQPGLHIQALSQMQQKVAF